MNTSARMLRLLSMLQTHRYWPGSELSERLEVSPRTLRRDIDRLRELGYSVDAVRGVAGGYQLRAGGTLPPLLLEDEEAVAIAVGLQSAASGSISGMEETSVQALTKIIGLMPPRLRRQMDAIRSQTENLPWRGGPDARRRTAHHPGAGLPRRRAAEVHLRRPRGRSHGPLGRTAPSRHGRPALVPRRLRPRPSGLALLPRRPDERPADDGPEVPAARASCRGRTCRSCRPGSSSEPQRYAVRVRIDAPVERVAGAVGHWGTASGEDGDCLLEMNLDSLEWPVVVLMAARRRLHRRGSQRARRAARPGGSTFRSGHLLS